MKKHIIATATIFIFSGCEIAIDMEKPFSIKIIEQEPVEVYRKGYVYCKLGESEPYTGKGFTTLNNREYKEVFTLKNGTKEGAYIQFNYDNVRVLREGNYKNGKYDGINYEYDDNTIEYLYKNGTKISGIIYNEDKKIIGEIEYKNDKPYKGYRFYKYSNNIYIKRIYNGNKYTDKSFTYNNYLKELK